MKIAGNANPTEETVPVIVVHVGVLPLNASTCPFDPAADIEVVLAAVWYGIEVATPPVRPAAVPSILVMPVSDWDAAALLIAMEVVPKKKLWLVAALAAKSAVRLVT